MNLVTEIACAKLCVDRPSCRSLFYEDGKCFLTDANITDRAQLAPRDNVKHYGKVSVTRIAAEGCSVRGFVYHPRGNICYRNRTTTRHTWHMASKVCKADGGALMKVDTEEKHKFMVTYGESTQLSLWIGGKGKVNWIWFDGTPIVKFYWQQSGKDGWPANCCLSYRWSDGQYRWDDANCNSPRGFFCEVPVKR
ncbi:type-2 ice-structuring protein-like [Haliotis rubra]|uniref:type-2 ice-structuring protein-like n=1 Tax=Haliotis rubra TaxID=36100 RepID=UPI001EE58564|nr:type-2 ice-structuring protein-like [Haliotis rubra]